MKESISQPALQIGVAIALEFSQWNLNGSDVHKFLAITLKKELFPPAFLSLLSAWNVNIMMAATAAMLVD